MLRTADVLEALSGVRPSLAGLEIRSATVDSRQVTPGALFVALPGEHVDGHNFVDQAFQRGAHLALVQKETAAAVNTLDLTGSLPAELPPLDEPLCLRVENSLEALQKAAAFWRQKLDLRVVGITGSVGKSTTKELVAEVLGQRYRTLKNPGNYNNEIGLPLTLLHLREEHERAVLEMGFYVPGEIQLLCDLAHPHVGVVTNIGTVHAERAGTQEVIARGKTELVQNLPPAPQGIAILNYDDAWVRPMAEHTSARVFYYGLSPRAHLWAGDVQVLGEQGIRFRLHYQQDSLQVQIPLLGRHQVYTALRAAAVGLVEGLTWEEILRGLQSPAARLRLVAVHLPGGALLLDDAYNAAPESTMAALDLLKDMPGRRVAVLGDMLELGPYETAGHEQVGRRAAETADELVTVGRRGRIIAAAARESGMAAVTELEDSERAIDYLLPRLGAGDVILVKGSHGMRMDRIVSALRTKAEAADEHVA